MNGGTCRAADLCAGHTDLIKTMGAILKRVVEIERKLVITERKTEAATTRIESIERRFLVMQKDMMAVMVDMQAASARSTEQLARYNVTLMEILFGIRELASKKAKS